MDKVGVKTPSAGPLVVNNKSYVKIQPVGKIGFVDDGSKKSKVQFWLCVEDGTKFPARTFVIPEVMEE